MSRLRRSRPDGPGWHRIRSGRRFRYVDANGNALRDAAVEARIEDLVIPPAWQDVWICPWPNGHIQATGVDAAGRVQYRYHDEWRKQRDQAKHERILTMARLLPAARGRLTDDLAGSGMSKRRVLAAAGRLLDLGFFRIGSDEYAEEHGAYGLTTLLRSHVTLHRRPASAVFDYVAKSGVRRVQVISEESVLQVVSALRRRRSGPPELLAYQDGKRWVRVDAADVNCYLGEIFEMGAEESVTAKDFRTWHGTVFMALALAVSEVPPTSESRRRRILARAYQEVAHHLGNTPAVCRASYVDPRLVELWDRGHTIRRSLDRLGADAEIGELATHGAIEDAVLRLLAKG